MFSLPVLDKLIHSTEGLGWGALWLTFDMVVEECQLPLAFFHFLSNESFCVPIETPFSTFCSGYSSLSISLFLSFCDTFLCLFITFRSDRVCGIQNIHDNFISNLFSFCIIRFSSKVKVFCLIWYRLLLNRYN